MDALKARSTENARKFVDTLPSPLKEIAWELHDYAMLLWFDVKGAECTRGYLRVIETGFTTNQKKWLEELKEQSPQGQAPLFKGDSGEEARCKAGHEVIFRDFRYLGHCEDDEVGTLCEGCESFVPKVSEPEPLGRGEPI